jgi:hypothetical protein
VRWACASTKAGPITPHRGRPLPGGAVPGRVVADPDDAAPADDDRAGIDPTVAEGDDPVGDEQRPPRRPLRVTGTPGGARRGVRDGHVVSRSSSTGGTDGRPPSPACHRRVAANTSCRRRSSSSAAPRSGGSGRPGVHRDGRGRRRARGRPAVRRCPPRRVGQVLHGRSQPRRQRAPAGSARTTRSGRPPLARTTRSASVGFVERGDDRGVGPECAGQPRGREAAHDRRDRSVLGGEDGHRDRAGGPVDADHHRTSSRGETRPAGGRSRRGPHRAAARRPRSAPSPPRPARRRAPRAGPPGSRPRSPPGRRTAGPRSRGTPPRPAPRPSRGAGGPDRRRRSARPGWRPSLVAEPAAFGDGLHEGRGQPGGVRAEALGPAPVVAARRGRPPRARAAARRPTARPARRAGWRSAVHHPGARAPGARRRVGRRWGRSWGSRGARRPGGEDEQDRDEQERPDPEHDAPAGDALAAELVADRPTRSTSPATADGERPTDEGGDQAPAPLAPSNPTATAPRSESTPPVSRTRRAGRRRCRSRSSATSVEGELTGRTHHLDAPG